jgi:hypothetical protein
MLERLENFLCFFYFIFNISRLDASLHEAIKRNLEGASGPSVAYFFFGDTLTHAEKIIENRA